MKEFCHGKITLLNCDCMEYMAGCGDNAFDLAICDPPYGLGECQKKVNGRSRSTKKWKNARPPQYCETEWDTSKPEPEYFIMLESLSKNRIIWGANHFGMMPPSSCWIVWYKKRFDEVNDFSDVEIAYTSFNSGARLFHFPWIGFGAINAGEKRIHNTQKPIALYKWLLSKYAKPEQRIFDSHLGSGSSAIAAHYFGCEFVGCEIDTDYFNAAVERFKRETRQMDMFSCAK